MKTQFPLFALVTSILLLAASPALAAGPGAAELPVFGAYLDDFIAYWKEKARQQNSIVMGIFVLGAVALLIIHSAGRKIK